jgi:hypothetical protein
MMRVLRTALVGLLVIGLASPAAFAGDLQASIAKAAEQAAAAPGGGGSKAAVWAGSALFVGGMAVGLYAFINDRNGKFSEFGEANSTNKKLGAAALGAAFAGGVLIFMGTHRPSASVSVGPGRLAVSKQVSW